MITGSGSLTYEIVDDWAHIPEELGGLDLTDVGADSQGRVFLFNRGTPAVIVLDRDGNYIESWGDSTTYPRPHALTIGPDDTIWLTDCADNTVRQCTAEGTILRTIGTSGFASPPLSNQPFNQCTHVAIDPRDGTIFVSDGYGNAAVHKFAPNGTHQHTWGGAGTGPGEFCVPHNIACDRDGHVYVADRHNSRVQVFNSAGDFEQAWQHMGLPHALHIDTSTDLQRAFVVELSSMTFVDTLAYGIPDWAHVPGNGHKITVRQLDGAVTATLYDNGIGLEPGQLVGPHGISVDSAGCIYVSELPYAATRTPRDGPDRLCSLHKLRPVVVPTEPRRNETSDG